MNETLNVLKRRRGCKSYQDRQITDAELDAVLEAGTYAPTGRNQQSPILVAVQNREALDTLRRLNVVDKTVITLFNKTDRIEGSCILKDFKADRTFQISAKTGAGFEEMKEGLQELLRSRNVYLDRLYSYSEAGKVQLIRKFGQLKSEEYTPEGIAVTGYVPAELYSQVL